MSQPYNNAVGQSDWLDDNLSVMTRDAARAGASPEFLAVLVADAGGRHQARGLVRRCNDTEELAYYAERGGHFMSALWAGDAVKAYRYADGDNTLLMERAGVKPDARSMVP